MAEAKFTPGPWTALPQCQVSDWVDIVTVIDGRASLPFAACKHFNEVANGRLIAAAPDMLALLVEIDAAYSKNGRTLPPAPQDDQHDPYTVWRKVRAAIAKAEGGAHG